MSPRKAAVLRDGGDQNLHDYLIATAARLIGQRGATGLSVRDIAREAQVADGVLYNYFEDKEDLLAQALLAHVGTVMASVSRMPEPGTGTVPENLRLFIGGGIDVLAQVMPAFAGLLAQPKVLSRFHAMVGGDQAFGVAADRAEADRDPGPGPSGLPEILTRYLRAEQRLGRIDEAADIEAATMLIVGAIHGQVLPRLIFSPPGSPAAAPPGLAARLAAAVLTGIAPRQPPASGR